MTENYLQTDPDSNVHGANMGPTWVLSAPDGPHFGPCYQGKLADTEWGTSSYVTPVLHS